MDITKFNTTPKSKGQIDMIFYKKSGAVLTDTPFFLALTEGVENYCQHTGYSLNIKYVYDTENVQQKLEDFIYAGAVGFILLGTEMMWKICVRLPFWISLLSCWTIIFVPQRWTVSRSIT